MIVSHGENKAYEKRLLMRPLFSDQNSFRFSFPVLRFPS